MNLTSQTSHTVAPSVKEMLAILKRAISDYGPNCFDSGVSDALAIEPLAERLRTASPVEAGRLLRSLANSGDSREFVERYSSQLAVALAMELGSWTALMTEPGISDILKRPSGIPDLVVGDSPVKPASIRRRTRP